MQDELDTRLANYQLPVPPDFAERVMRAIAQQSVALSTAFGAQPAPPRASAFAHLRWLAAAVGLAGAGALGLSQVAGFVGGLWIATTAL